VSDPAPKLLLPLDPALPVAPVELLPVAPDELPARGEPEMPAPAEPDVLLSPDVVVPGVVPADGLVRAPVLPA
jgi:hypothetical protein